MRSIAHISNSIALSAVSSVSKRITCFIVVGLARAIYTYGVYTVFLAGISSNIPSITCAKFEDDQGFHSFQVFINDPSTNRLTNVVQAYKQCRGQ